MTSHFWHGGTIVTAAITPVIVALAKEVLERQIKSEVVRRPVQRFATTSRTRAAQAPRVREPVGHGAPPYEPPSRREPEPRRLEPREPGMAPFRTYGRPRRRWHVRAAIVTGVVAFAIAALVLTVPELLFGGSVAGHGRTTFFSTSSGSSSKGSSSKSGSNSSNSNSGNSQTNTTQTTPSQQSPGTSTSTQPQQQSPPSQGAPQGGTTAPQQPAPSTPPAP